MTTASAPPPYTSTTAAHLTRFVAIWVTGMALLLFLLTSGQLLVWDDPGGLLLALGLLAAGIGTWVGARARLDHLHRRNREFLLSEDGIQAMRGRAAFAARVRRWTWTLLAVFILAGVVVILAGSSLDCIGQRPGTCSLPVIDRSVFLTARAIAIAAGSAYVGLVILGRSHALETDRMDEVIGEGQRRRLEGPVPGLKRHRWE